MTLTSRTWGPLAVLFFSLAAASAGAQNVLITAETPALRAWLAGALKDETIFAEWKTFTRRTK